MAEQEKETVFKVVLIGDSQTGKTHLLNRFLKGTLPKGPQPTIGVEFATKQVKLENDSTVKVQFWDTAGQERYKSITATHYRKSIGALLVYDITKETTYDNINKWMEDLKLSAEPNIVIMLVGNKIDQIDNKPEDRKVQKQEAENFAKENGLIFQETSALTGNNVNQTFNALIEAINKVQKNGGAVQDGDPVIQINNQEDKSEAVDKGCAC